MKEQTNLFQAPTETAPKEQTMLAVIERAATNPDVDIAKMQQLLDMQERIMAKQAEIDFNQAMARLQPRLPTITRRHSAKGKEGKAMWDYARYEDIDREVRPFYTAEGFSISYNSAKDGSDVVYYGTLAHQGGHSKTASMILPADATGSKNSIQAIGSTVSYARRYLISMLLNIVLAEEDDDGVKGGSRMITAPQIKEIDDLIDEIGLDRDRFFFDYMKMDVADAQYITAINFNKAKNALIRRRDSQKPITGETSHASL